MINATIISGISKIFSIGFPIVFGYIIKRTILFKKIEKKTNLNKGALIFLIKSLLFSFISLIISLIIAFTIISTML
jgi:putative flippase GtrA